MRTDSTDKITASWGTAPAEWSVLVHGGAGDLPVDRVERHVQGCRQAALAAAEILRAGGSALDAVERAVVVLEDDPSFNAGTGACLNEEGLIELDAAIVEGTGLRAGAVCAMPPFANPIAIARAVLEDGRHVLYAAEGAARFAIERGFARATSEAMTTEHARARWVEIQAARVAAATGAAGGGTVGAVARDTRRGVAAATSTGGRIDKRVGRVGDSPVIGAGTYADDGAGACSATGAGEAILRVGLTRGAADLMRGGVHPEEAARAAIRSMGARVGGTGGLIVVDRAGRLGFARNTRTMTWAAAAADVDLAAGA